MKDPIRDYWQPKHFYVLVSGFYHTNERKSKGPSGPDNQKFKFLCPYRFNLVLCIVSINAACSFGCGKCCRTTSCYTALPFDHVKDGKNRMLDLMIVGFEWWNFWRVLNDSKTWISKMLRESQKRWKSRSNSLFWRNWAVELECASDEMTILNSYVGWWYINFESQLVSHRSSVQLWLSFCESFILVFLDSICLFFKINRNKLTSKHPSMIIINAVSDTPGT